MRYVIVGGGIAGVTAAQRLRALDPSSSVVLFEAEPVPFYLRPGLIEVLAGAKDLSEITPYARSWFESRGIEYRLGEAVVGLNLAKKDVLLATGRSVPYDRLLLATGAEPVRPAIPGIDLPGVFTLRTAADAERIRTWAEGRRSAVVLGGGWLGLEAAYALRRSLEEVVVLDRGRWPLSRHLDEKGGKVLSDLLGERGLTVLSGVEAAEILGEGEVKGVRLTTGERLPADLVLVAAGVIPRVGLAREAGITVNKGILVDDFLETSAPGVYAAGDGAEWRGKTYGIVPAAREQAQVAAQNMVDPKSLVYPGTKPVQRLKVAGVDLLVLGEPPAAGGSFAEETLAEPGRYAKLVLGEGRRLLAAVVLGMPEIMSEIERRFREGEPIPSGSLSA